MRVFRSIRDLTSFSFSGEDGTGEGHARYSKRP